MTHGRANQKVPGLHSHCLRRPCALLLAAALVAPQLLAAALPMGRVVGWNPTVAPLASSNIVAVSSYGDMEHIGYSVALSDSGMLTPFGFDLPGFMTNPPPTLSDVVAISVSLHHALALRKNGTVVVWGDFPQLVTNMPPDLSNVVAISAAAGHSLALRDDGSLVAWGAVSRTNVPAGLSNVIAISAGQSTDLAVKSDGTVVGWGGGSGMNIPADLSNVVSIAVGSYASLAARADGSVAIWGSGFSISHVDGLSNVLRVASGPVFAGGIKRDGRVFIWPEVPGSVSDVPTDLSNVVSLAVASGNGQFALAVTIDSQITALERTNQQAAIRFPTFSGQQYAVEASPNLSPGSWSNLTTVPGTGSEARVTDTNAIGPARFYRLRQP